MTYEMRTIGRLDCSISPTPFHSHIEHTLAAGAIHLLLWLCICCVAAYAAIQTTCSMHSSPWFRRFAALDPGPNLNGYSITYVIHSLWTSCSELEWVWNSADYWRSRQFQVHVVLITNEHLKSWAHFNIDVWNIRIYIACTRCHCTIFIYIDSFTIHMVKFYLSVN